MNRIGRLAALALGLLPFAAGAPARGEVVQSGPGNLAIQFRPGGGSPEIEQHGRKNLAVQVQEEARNRAVIRQEGERNTAVQRQSGRNNTAIIRQTTGLEGEKPPPNGTPEVVIQEKDGRD